VNIAAASESVIGLSFWRAVTYTTALARTREIPRSSRKRKNGGWKWKQTWKIAIEKITGLICTWPWFLFEQLLSIVLRLPRGGVLQVDEAALLVHALQRRPHLRRVHVRTWKGIQGEKGSEMSNIQRMKDNERGWVVLTNLAPRDSKPRKQEKETRAWKKKKKKERKKGINQYLRGECKSPRALHHQRRNQPRASPAGKQQEKNAQIMVAIRDR
jgi:hypothetical protein